MGTVVFDENMKDKHSQNMAELFNSFDVQAIPEDFIKILDSGEIEFIYTSRRSSVLGKVAEICVVFKNVDVYRKIYALYDYGYCVKYQEIPLKAYNTCEGRNAEIKRLYKEAGLTQVFIGRFFKLSQPSISLILKKDKEDNNE